MRRILSALTVAVAAILITGSAALAQTNTPTSFSGGPDATSDATTRGPAVNPLPDGPVVAGTADETDGGSSVGGWLVGALVVVAVLGGLALVARRSQDRAPAEV